MRHLDSLSQRQEREDIDITMITFQKQATRFLMKAGLLLLLGGVALALLANADEPSDELVEFKPATEGTFAMEMADYLAQTEPVIKDYSQPALARKSRKWGCHIAWQELKDEIDNIHEKPVERCATLATLQYAWESGYGQKGHCVSQAWKKNCYGIMRWIDGVRSIKPFDSYQDADLAYARLYFKGYQHRSLWNHIVRYSGNDRPDIYHNFIVSKYEETMEYFLNN